MSICFNIACSSYKRTQVCCYTIKQSKQGQGERLARVLQTTGIASRRKAEELVFDGRVQVNGVTIRVPQTIVDRKGDVILVDNKKIASSKPQLLLYYLLNKPKGYLCSNKGFQEGDKLVVDLLQSELNNHKQRKKNATIPPLFTVGRLDKNTTGMLLVTNDGVWAQQVSHPSNKVSKEYVVVVGCLPTRKQFEMLTKGTYVDGKMVVPQYVGLINDGHPDRFRVRIVVGDGRNREVRQLMEFAGLDVASLKRVRIGGLKMPQDLRLKEFRQLTHRQRKQITDYGVQQSILGQLRQDTVQ